MNDLMKEWKHARIMFQHYAIKYFYDYGEHRRTISPEEKQYCFEQANYYENLYTKLQKEIIMRKSNNTS